MAWEHFKIILLPQGLRVVALRQPRPPLALVSLHTFHARCHHPCSAPAHHSALLAGSILPQLAAGWLGEEHKATVDFPSLLILPLESQAWAMIGNKG